MCGVHLACRIALGLHDSTLLNNPLAKQMFIGFVCACVQIQISIGNAEEKYYCQGLDLTSLSQGPTSNGLVQLTTPLSAFNCDLSRVDQVSFGPSPSHAITILLEADLQADQKMFVAADLLCVHEFSC